METVGLDDYRTASRVLDMANEGVLIADSNSLEFLYANAKICAMLGCSKEDMLGLRVPDIHPEEVKETILEKFKTICRGEKADTRGLLCRTKDKGVFFADIHTSHISVKDRDCLIGYFTDVTQRVKVQKELENNAKKYRDLSLMLETVFDSIPDLIGVQNLCHEVIRYNKAGYDFLSTDPEGVKGKKCYELIGRDRPCKICATTEVYKTKKPARKERFFHEFKKWLEVNAYPVLNEEGELKRIIEHIRDITQLKRAEADRIKYEQKIQQSQKLESLGILAGGIAHDFNNLLGGIYGYLYMARSKVCDKEAIEYLDTTLKTMNRARNLTQQLLTFSKGGVPNLKKEGLKDFLRETICFSSSGSKVSVQTEIEDDLWICNYDPNQMGQVINNIIINAQQAMPRGGRIRVTATNVVFGKNDHANLAPGCYARISIADMGIGIPKDLLNRVFDPFFTTKQRGSGLGLATSYSIVKKHGGIIDIESEPNKGSTFNVYLPALQEIMTDEHSKTRKDTSIGNGRILIMDDEEVMRGVLTKMLRRKGYSPVAAADGEEALSLFWKSIQQGRPFSGVILDLTIPGGLGGKDVIAEIREKDKQTPVLVSSGYSEDPIIQRPEQYGFNASITKPFSYSELIEVVSEHFTGES